MIGRRTVLLLALLALACGRKSSRSTDAANGKDGVVALNGAGATFPFPLYSKWTAEYNRLYPNVRINYQSIGSGGGIRQIVAQTVDFGASDAAMQPSEAAGAPGKITHIPTVIGSVVVTYNLEGVNAPLKLTPEALAGIFLGEVKKWNDPRIAEHNPGVPLPDKDIAVVYRSDGSGTTAVFTEYLSTCPLYTFEAAEKEDS
nr:MAG: phosphate ABC transporter substrate-binding protein PstS [Pseudomonadota bacterium]